MLRRMVSLMAVPMLATLMIASVLALMYVLNRFMKLSVVFGGVAR